MNPNEGRLVQLHWQNSRDVSDTILVAERRFNHPDDAHAWARRLIERRADEAPHGWGPMVMLPEGSNG